MPSSSREEEDCASSPKKERVMTMVIFFHTSVAVSYTHLTLPTKRIV